MTRSGLIGHGKRRTAQALILAVLAGVALGGGVDRAAAAATGVARDGLPAGGFLVERHHYGPAAPAQAQWHGPERTLGERQETRWRRGSPVHGMPAVTAAGPVRLHEAPGGALETDIDGTLVRAGRRGSWPTGPPILSL